MTVAASWDDLASEIELTGDARHRHIPGSPMEYKHDWDPMTEAAARSHFKGSVPKSWHAPSGGTGGEAGRPAVMKAGGELKPGDRVPSMPGTGVVASTSHVAKSARAGGRTRVKFTDGKAASVKDGARIPVHPAGGTGGRDAAPARPRAAAKAVPAVKPAAAKPADGLEVTKAGKSWIMRENGEPLESFSTRKAAQAKVDGMRAQRARFAQADEDKRQQVAALLARHGLRQVDPAGLKPGDQFTTTPGAPLRTVTEAHPFGNGNVMVTFEKDAYTPRGQNITPLGPSQPVYGPAGKAAPAGGESAAMARFRALRVQAKDAEAHDFGKAAGLYEKAAAELPGGHPARTALENRAASLRARAPEDKRVREEPKAGKPAGQAGTGADTAVRAANAERARGATVKEGSYETGRAIADALTRAARTGKPHYVIPTSVGMQVDTKGNPVGGHIRVDPSGEVSQWDYQRGQHAKASVMPDQAVRSLLGRHLSGTPYTPPAPGSSGPAARKRKDIARAVKDLQANPKLRTPEVLGRLRAIAASSGSLDLIPAEWGLARTWDDVALVLEMTGDANHIHIPGSPYEWKHPYIPISEAAARSHGGGKVPKGWKAPSGGGAGKGKTAPTSYDVNGIAAKVSKVDARYRASAAIGHVIPEKGSTYGPMVSLVNDFKHGRLDPADTARFHAENFPRSTAEQADRAEAIAQVLDRLDHSDEDVRKWMPEHPAEVAKAAAGLHEYARAAREALAGKGTAKADPVGRLTRSSDPASVARGMTDAELAEAAKGLGGRTTWTTPLEHERASSAVQVEKDRRQLAARQAEQAKAKAAADAAEAERSRPEREAAAARQAELERGTVQKAGGDLKPGDRVAGVPGTGVVESTSSTPAGTRIKFTDSKVAYLADGGQLPVHPQAHAAVKVTRQDLTRIRKQTGVDLAPPEAYLPGPYREDYAAALSHLAAGRNDEAGAAADRMVQHARESKNKNTLRGAEGLRAKIRDAIGKPAAAPSPRPGAASVPKPTQAADAEWKKAMDEMAAKEAAAGTANARGMDRMQAHHDAARQYLRESAGITIPFAQDFGLGLGHSDYAQAENHLLNDRYEQAAAALGRALAAERSRPGRMSKAQAARLGKLEKFRAQVTQAAAHPKSTLPVLARLPGARRPDGSFTALDQNGVEHQVSLKNGQVTVSRGGKTLAAPAGENPTMTARKLAAQLAGTALSRDGQPAIDLAVRAPARTPGLQAVKSPPSAARKAPPGRPLGKSPGAVSPGRGSQGAAPSTVPDPNGSPPASRRRGVTPLTPMRQAAAKSMRKLAAHVQESHPDMSVHDHLRDAARTLESGNEEASQRHLRAAMFALTPQSLMRNGLHTDEHHQGARSVMHGVHRHLLLVKDITDVAAKNQASIARLGTEDDTAPRPDRDPNNGYGPGALAQKPTARQPPGNQALNAPNRGSSGGSDPAVADPDGPQPRGSKQFTTGNGAGAVTELAYGWDELAAVLELAAVAGHHAAGTGYDWKHGWDPLTEAAARSHFKGSIPKSWHASSGSRGKSARSGAVRKAVAAEAKRRGITRAPAAAVPAKAAEAVAPDPRMEAARHHADWMRVGNFRDSTDHETGYKSSSLWQTSDFGASVHEGHAAGTGWDSNAKQYKWNIGRQRTEREGPDAHGAWSEGPLATGTEPTMAKAKAAALKAMKQARAAHIAAGGDVGYGDAPTGAEIRAAAKAHRQTVLAAYGWEELPALELAAGDDCYRCSTPNAPDARYCKRCGNPMEPRQPYDRFAEEDITCPFCGRGDDRDAVFCDQCGKRLPEGPVAAFANTRRAVDLSARTAMLERTPAPRGKPGGPGLYGVAGQEHTHYLQQVVKALIEKRGMPPSKAYAIAYGALRKWARGGGKVHGEVRAAAAGALAGEAAKVHGHAVTWGDLASVIDLSFNPAQARVAAGSATAGQFAPANGGTPPPAAQQPAGGKQPAKPPAQTPAQKAAAAHAAHVAHVAHLNGVSTAKAELLVTAQDDQQKADALIKQRDALTAALASAGGKTSKGQAGSKTASTAKTKTTAPAAPGTAAAGTAKAGTTTASTSKTSAAAAKTTAAKTATSAKSAATAVAAAAGSTAAIKAQIAQLNIQIGALLAAAAQATAQAAAMK